MQPRTMINEPNGKGVDAHPILVDVPHACALLSIGRTTLNALMATGELRTVRIGRRRLVPVTEIERFVDALVSSSA